MFCEISPKSDVPMVTKYRVFIVKSFNKKLENSGLLTFGQSAVLFFVANN